MRSGSTPATTGHKERLAAQRQAIHKDVKIICFDVMFVLILKIKKHKSF